ncbi:hypothetical protein COU96_03060 [Candidatus Shapirobacteria bacterium CG10_big_fil_rev_8_21_14_0_10_38_14]|uniref:Uncharacterized protein n=1 Tax=Candidatus Shapirobacteria bacterium CG10_big_fil_rev_8_21_14_0_10_38_14 TaxID=1974483 RepID=A0A2M8L4R9_9BACT|nr:MAG: hypothetical protein COU96_03060 [Candidatus Shapirobacteria bacterium CG10_big_fil_rev_8_21_14_0_10_38_14]
MLKHAGKGLDPYKKSKYWHEKQAYKFKFNFENKCLPKKVKNALRGEILGDFLTTFLSMKFIPTPIKALTKPMPEQ